MRKVIVIAMLLILGPGSRISFSQSASVYVDDAGVMRWSADQGEVYGFGVNYTVPFAHGFRAAKKLGVDPRQAIDQDVYHFARLGFDAYRVHVWDTEISDSLGNLLENEHLDVFDYMIKKMQDRDMNMLITPIAFWGNGWPEPNEDTPGFANKYGKDGCLTNEQAIKAQENYLFQFLNHVNPYTGLAYKDDPAVVAFEVSNEPHHRQQADSVTRYVKKMVGAMKRTGCEKPIFYNISHGVHLVDAYFGAGIDGGTFQWYPTGLGAGEELKGNFLPNVDRYEIPFADNPRFQRTAKVVYEFDAADIGRSYIYPAMARSFRTAGIQWATHFAYDPTYMAYANTEYNTHYMNLAYTPRKALALKIAGAVFHDVPRYQDYGRYPENASFGDFAVSYEEDLAEYNTASTFIYTNHTTTQPTNAASLKEIAGWGNSPIVKYEGTGAYFLDEVARGVWRLEVMPDVVWVQDPFGKNSLNRKLSEIVWSTRSMSVALPTLGDQYTVQAINTGNEHKTLVDKQTFNIRPGTYLLMGKGASHKVAPTDKWKNIRIGEFTAPAATISTTYVLHEPVSQLIVGQSLTVSTRVVSEQVPAEVYLITYQGWQPVKTPMQKGHGFEYTAEIKAEDIRPGMLRYYIEVVSDKGVETFPGAVPGSISDWDFAGQPYSVDVLSENEPLFLYNALSDEEEVSREWKPGTYIAPLADPGKAELVLKIDALHCVDEENLNAEPIYDYTMRYNFKERLRGRSGDLQGFQRLVVRGRNMGVGSVPIQVALVQSDGQAFGAKVELGEKDDYCIRIGELKPVPMVIMPRPYPSFLPYFFGGASHGNIDLSQIETIQVSIGPGLRGDQLRDSYEIALESVCLDQ